MIKVRCLLCAAFGQEDCGQGAHVAIILVLLLGVAALAVAFALWSW
jgi:hypothetical protein